ncbi:BZ3500_MvSof-1268-A1-R1_Chr6-3g08968 [Microbotryum saponariae]|uniref:BZ3500_MvSof-1268-A1-R1_Chr6-3g08968 protein n=1 Tax=Microbotryum saponariae TaxID=289078 RepID=A0A2X0LPZ1_9BASI|nr:BZ3500_MvSof-1268-A1-R1_Chr6-3g08968 [Microbotryum saponariae]SDA07570.1 BZ3501_MvSof-1269-A2-R1_Chr6-2g08672 [Microbotryum saponariae]
MSSSFEPPPIEMYTQRAYVYPDPPPPQRQRVSHTTQLERGLTSSSMASSSHAPSSRSAQSVVRPSSSSPPPPERPRTQKVKAGSTSGKATSSRHSASTQSTRRPIPSSSSSASSSVSMGASVPSSSRLSAPSSTATQRKRSRFQPGDGFAMDFGQRRTTSCLLPPPSLPPAPSVSRLTSEQPIASTSRIIAPHRSSPPRSPQIQTVHRTTTPTRPQAVDCERSPLSTPRASQYPPQSTIPQPSSAPPTKPPIEVIFLSSSPEPSPSSTGTILSLSTPRSKPAPALHPSVYAKLASLDKDLISDPHLAPSILFQCEVVNHGPATYEQRDEAGRKILKRTRRGRRQEDDFWPRREGPTRPWVSPNWIDDHVNVDKLKRRIEEKEHFVANVKIKDVVDETSVQGMSELLVDGVEMCILGKEFPLKRVVVVGTIVGDDWKHDKPVYYVDDGTGVVACVCTTQEGLPQIALPRESYQASLASPTKQPRKRKVLDALPEDEIDATFEVGTLVRVLARVEKASLNFAGRRYLSVIKMEFLKDPNAFITHQLLVHELHEQVYSQPFNLALRFEEIHQTDLSLADTTSDALSTPPSTPKKYRLPRASKLLPEDLTPSTFAHYIKFHLKRHFVELGTRTSEDEDDSFCAANFGEVPSDPEVPIEFTLDDLKRDRDLIKFATRMVRIQHMEMKRVRMIKQERILKGSKKTAWVEKARWYEGGVTLLAPPGSRGGSAWFLNAGLKKGAIGSEKSSRKSKREPQETEAMLDGERLDKAINSAFTAALIRLREQGEIILTPEQEDPDALARLLDPEPETESIPEDLPDQPQWGKPGKKSPSKRTKARDPLALEGFTSLEPSPSQAQEASPSPLSEHRANKGNYEHNDERFVMTFGTPEKDEEACPYWNARVTVPSIIQTPPRKSHSWLSPPTRRVQTYQLVTTTSLLVPVYRIITNLYTASIESCAATWKARQHVSVIEEQIRGAMLHDEVWEQVGKKSHLVNEAVKELVLLNKVEWVKMGNEKTGQYFVEGAKHAVRLKGMNGMGGVAKKSTAARKR